MLPYAVLACALLMVSSVRYVHVGNAYLRGRRPFEQFVIFLVVLGILLWHPVLTMAGGSCLYAGSGPVAWVLRRLRPRPQQPPATEVPAAPENPAETRKLG
jgi:phosphatidylserine synthase